MAPSLGRMTRTSRERRCGEHRAVDAHARLLELFVESRRPAEGDVLAEDFALRADAAAFELEQRLGQDHVALHPIDLDDGGDAAAAVAEARLLDDDVDRG